MLQARTVLRGLLLVQAHEHDVFSQRLRTGVANLMIDTGRAALNSGLGERVKGSVYTWQLYSLLKVL